MANVIDPKLKRVAIADPIQGYVTRKTLPIRSFSMDISTELRDDGDTVDVPIRMGAGEPMFNLADNWNHSDLKREKISVNLQRISRPVILNNSEQSNGHKLSDAVAEMVESIKKGIRLYIEWVSRNATQVNVGSTAAFSYKTINEIVWPSIKIGASQPSLFLTPSFYSKLLPTDQISLTPEYKGVFAEIERYEQGGLDKKLAGFAFNPGAFALGNRLPHEASDTEKKTYSYQQIIENEETGLVFLYSEWGTPGARSMHASLDTLIGLKLAVPHNVLILKNGETDWEPDAIADLNEAA